ncbi:hypothetical protein HF329_08245 [Chitinophaga oryzae]|uniref:Uncharacterized protein n=1 Tax=Chitinophaga oryzae TaxID=2725414 RepID=A0AAE6ZGW9_9BACT|nr:hypothetical protein [Chitinophaga oryzae]QJB31293.1 hypothetical protein HF329_08245 [Chitinophaga oryzae]
MHRIKSLLAGILLAADVITAQSRPTGHPEIRRTVQQINRDSTLKQVTLNNEEWMTEMSDGGGSLTGYYKNKTLVKAVRWIGYSSGVEIVEFYFKDNKLLFVYEQSDLFFYDEKKGMLRTDSLVRNFEGRYYFSGKKMIDYTTLGHNRFENDSLDAAKIWPQEAATCRRLLARKVAR